MKYLKIIFSTLAILMVYSVFGQDLINQGRMLRHPTYLKEYKNTSEDSIKNLPASSKFTIVDKEGEYYRVYFWSWGSNDTEIENTQSEIERKKTELDRKKTEHSNLSDAQKITDDDLKEDRLESLNEDLKTLEEDIDNLESEKKSLEEGNSKYVTFNVNPATNETRYFLIPVSEIEQVSIEIYNRVSPSIGILTFPFKYRFNDKSFEPSFNLNLVGGFEFNPFHKKTHTFSLLIGVGATSVQLTPENTGPSADLQKELSAAAVTFSASFVYKFRQLQIGISSGIDNIFNNNIYDWTNQSRPWISGGIGLDIFKDSKPADPKNN